MPANPANLGDHAMKKDTNYNWTHDADGKSVREHIGPEYPKLGESVQFFRREIEAHGGPLSAIDQCVRIKYGDAVERAIRALQRSELNSAGRRMPLTHREPIGKARAASQRARLLACPGAIRRARPSHVWQELYDEAMAEKRERMLDDEYGPRLQNSA